MQSFRVLGGDIFGGELGSTRLAGGSGCAPVDAIDGSVSSGATFTHPADGVIAWTQTTVPSSGTTRVRFRTESVGNWWEVHVSDIGSLILYERVSTPTLRANLAGAVSNGDRIVIVMDGTTITGYVDSVEVWSYESASNFQTETDGDVLFVGDGSAIADLKTWSLACRGKEGV